MSADELNVGTHLGPYRIERQLGKGGMGVVYQAHDTKLQRAVAVKFLSAEVADSAARRRFQSEAELASSLAHPHILTVHDVGEFEGRQYLVTELVGGGTLRDWVRSQRPSWRQIVEMLVGVADGLAAAHAAGIVHRDIKPENVLITQNGYAKLDESATKGTDGNAATAAFTRPGTVIGTAAYMSPEQAAGRAIDARSDIFSFGVLLYELLAGRPPFEGATYLDVLHAVYHTAHEPLPDSIPSELRMVVEKALEKDPSDRYQSMRELVVDMRRLARQRHAATALQSAHAPQPSLGTSSWKSRVAWLAVVPIALVAGAAGWLLHSRLREPNTARIVNVRRLTDLVGLEEEPAISPDGKSIAFVAMANGRRQIWVRLLSGGNPLAITRDDVDHYGPRWSPDSASLIYYTTGSQPEESGTIWEIPALGGTAQRLVTAVGPGDLSHDGRQLAYFRFQDGGVELAVVARDQSVRRTIAQLPDGAYFTLRWSPDDRQLAILGYSNSVRFATNLTIADVVS